MESIVYGEGTAAETGINWVQKRQENLLLQLAFQQQFLEDSYENLGCTKITKFGKILKLSKGKGTFLPDRIAQDI